MFAQTERERGGRGGRKGESGREGGREGRERERETFARARVCDSNKTSHPVHCG